MQVTGAAVFVPALAALALAANARGGTSAPDPAGPGAGPGGAQSARHRATLMPIVGDPFKVRGSRWEIVYSMGYKGTCQLLFICSGPDAHIANLSGGADPHGFSLDDGANRVWTFDPSGPGTYQVTITPGSDQAHWSAQIQDYY